MKIEKINENQIRCTLMETDTKLEIFVDGDSIILKKHRPIGSCDFCGEVDDKAVHYAGYCICSECRQRISEL